MLPFTQPSLRFLEGATVTTGNIPHIIPERGGAWNWLVNDDQGLRSVLETNEFHAWLEANPGQVYWICYRYETRSDLRIADATWRALTTVCKTHLVRVYNPDTHEYLRWNGQIIDLRRFSGLTIEPKHFSLSARP